VTTTLRRGGQSNHAAQVSDAVGTIREPSRMTRGLPATVWRFVGTTSLLVAVVAERDCGKWVSRSPELRLVGDGSHLARAELASSETLPAPSAVVSAYRAETSRRPNLSSDRNLLDSEPFSIR
jgi:hypothetical protein